MLSERSPGLRVLRYFKAALGTRGQPSQMLLKGGVRHSILFLTL